MCQPKPGPRCASHLRAALARAREHAAQNRQAFDDGVPRPHPHAEGRILELLDEWDETPTGQRELDTLIARAEAEGAPEFEIDILRSRKASGRERHEAKTAALASMKAGYPAVARFQMRYGAHAGWLGHTTLAAEVKAGDGDLTVYPEYAVGTAFTDHHTESTPDGRDFYVSESRLIIQAPVRPGPTPGTWITGLGAPRSDGTRRYQRGNETFGPVVDIYTNPRCHLIDLRPGADPAQSQPTIAAYDPDTATAGTPQRLDDFEGLMRLDHNDSQGLSDFRDRGSLTTTMATPQVLDLPDGSHVVSMTYDTQAEVARSSHRYYEA